MKKTGLLFVLLFASFKLFAITYNCNSSARQQYMANATTYTCGNANVQAASGDNRHDAVCYYVAHGGTYASSNGTPTLITNCARAIDLPVNIGLLFIIMGCVGLGGYLFAKRNQVMAVAF